MVEDNGLRWVVIRADVPVARTDGQKQDVGPLVSADVQFAAAVDVHVFGDGGIYHSVGGQIEGLQRVGEVLRGVKRHGRAGGQVETDLRRFVVQEFDFDDVGTPAQFDVRDAGIVAFFDDAAVNADASLPLTALHHAELVAGCLRHFQPPDPINGEVFAGDVEVAGLVVPDGRKRVVAPQVWPIRFVSIKVVGVIPPVRHAATGVEGVAPGVLQRGVLRQLAQICAGDDVLQGGQMGRDVSCLRRAQPFRIRRQFQRLFADDRSRQRYAGRRHSCWCQIASSSLVLGRRRSMANILNYSYRY